MSIEYQNSLNGEEFRTLNPEDRLALFRSGNKEDRHRLVLSMLRLVKKVAKTKYDSLSYGAMVPLDDLIQASVEGIYNSFEDFDENHPSGSGLVTHARWRMWGKMSSLVGKEIRERKRNKKWAIGNRKFSNRLRRPVEEAVEVPYWEVIKERFQNYVTEFPDPEAKPRLLDELRAIELKYFSDPERILSNGEVGEMMGGISRGTVSNLVRDGIKRSREFIRDLL